MAGESLPDPLAELRDIHLPAAPELWPPAPGWWLLGLILAGLCFYGIYLLIQLWRKNAYRRQALIELERIFEQSTHSESQLLADINELLKRVALSRFPREEVAQLSGESWVAFLDTRVKTQDFSMGAGQVLMDGPYTAAPKTPTDITELQRITRHWIQHHKAVGS